MESSMLKTQSQRQAGQDLAWLWNNPAESDVKFIISWSGTGGVVGSNTSRQQAKAPGSDSSRTSTADRSSLASSSSATSSNSSGSSGSAETSTEADSSDEGTTSGSSSPAAPSTPNRSVKGKTQNRAAALKGATGAGFAAGGSQSAGSHGQQVYFMRSSAIEQASAVLAKRLKTATAAPKGTDSGSARYITLQETLPPGELDCAEIVLRHMHFGRLSTRITVPEELLRAMRLSVTWGAQRCLYDCLTALGNMPPAQLGSPSSVSTAYALHASFPSDIARGVAEALQKGLLYYYGDLNTLLESAASSSQRRNFQALPWQAVASLLSSDKLRTDSENTVLAALALWADNAWAASRTARNSSMRLSLQARGERSVGAATAAAAATTGTQGQLTAILSDASGPGALDESALQQLGACLRTCQLSASFLTCAMPQLPWLRLPPSARRSMNHMLLITAASPEAKALYKAQGLLTVDADAKRPRAWTRAGSLDMEFEISMKELTTFLQAALQQLKRDGKSSRTTLQRRAGCPFVYRGCAWGLMLRMSSSSSSSLGPGEERRPVLSVGAVAEPLMVLEPDSSLSVVYSYHVGLMTGDHVGRLVPAGSFTGCTTLTQGRSGTRSLVHMYESSLFSTVMLHQEPASWRPFMSGGDVLRFRLTVYGPGFE